MTSWDIDPTGVALVISEVAEHAETMRRVDGEVTGGGDTVAARLARSVTVHEAFERFWAARSPMGDRLVRNIARKSGGFADAARAFVDADGRMSEAARTAMGRVEADVAAAFAPLSGG